jgi:hypothetical protein
MGTTRALRRFAGMRTRGSQLRLFCRLAILAATIVAVVPQQSSAGTQRPAARHHLRHRLVRHAARQPLRLRLPAADDFNDGWAGGRDVAFALPEPVGDRAQTAIDYRLASRGPVGSLGLLRPSDTHAAQPAYAGPAATLRRGYPEVTAGAKLSYPF